MQSRPQEIELQVEAPLREISDTEAWLFDQQVRQLGGSHNEDYVQRKLPRVGAGKELLIEIQAVGNDPEVPNWL
jgi:hypothetical protein